MLHLTTFIIITLQATLVVMEYTDELDDPGACKLEVILHLFNCQYNLDQTKSVKNTRC